MLDAGSLKEGCSGGWIAVGLGRFSGLGVGSQNSGTVITSHYNLCRDTYIHIFTYIYINIQYFKSEQRPLFDLRNTWKASGA